MGHGSQNPSIICDNTSLHVFPSGKKTEQDLQSNWFEFFKAVNSETNNSMGFKVSKVSTRVNVKIIGEIYLYIFIWGDS